MLDPLIIVITGPPASGKSSVARRVTARFALPWVSKDGIKETLYDSLGYHNRRASGRLSTATQDLLFHFADVLLAARQPFVLESNFRPRRDAEAFRRLASRHPYRALQVHCDAPAPVLVRRFLNRWEAGRRHPGHADDLTAQDIAHDIRTGEFAPLDLPGQTVHLDTGDFEGIDFPALYAAIGAALAEGTEEPLAPPAR
ncbi:MAG: ATP-binding protein [Chloroflexi bacterium]|nr:ATP-binding protein [Chloroflexota bacterium]